MPRVIPPDENPFGPNFAQEQEEKANNDADFKRIENAATVLIEHFDAVQIFASKHTSTGTVAHHHGKGNYYARRGYVQTWLLKENEISRTETHEESED